jgi:hypothetical protein
MRVRRSCAVSDGRRGTDHGLCCGPGPNGGHVQTGHDLHPSNRHRIGFRRDEVAPIEPSNMVAESNILHAICSAFPLDTNNRLSTQTRGLELGAEREQHVAAVADQF